jgi:hypothetical protein
MPVMLERWNDDKMDALASKVDGLGVELREQRKEFQEQRNEFRKELREQGKETNAGLVGLHRLLVQTTVAVLSAFVIGFGALIGLIATQL